MIFTSIGQTNLQGVIWTTLVSCGISLEDEADNHAELILQAVTQEMLRMARESGKKGSPHEPPEPPDGGGTSVRAIA